MAQTQKTISTIVDLKRILTRVGSGYSVGINFFTFRYSDNTIRNYTGQAKLRIASVFQLRGEHGRAVETFRHVLNDNGCDHCRLQGQLGLIESYEHLDRLPEAIEIAESISEAEYPAPMREQLLGRLTEKRKYYEPSLQVR